MLYVCHVLMSSKTQLQFIDAITQLLLDENSVCLDCFLQSFCLFFWSALMCLDLHLIVFLILDFHLWTCDEIILTGTTTVACRSINFIICCGLDVDDRLVIYLELNVIGFVISCLSLIMFHSGSHYEVTLLGCQTENSYTCCCVI